MKILEITDVIREQLNAPLPNEAVTQHPTKSYLSSIKAIYVIERLNSVFGIGKWNYTQKVIEKLANGTVVVEVDLFVPAYGIHLTSFGGNDNGGAESKNFDLGDAYKGAVTDAITKICSMLEIGIDVFKGLHVHKKLPLLNDPGFKTALGRINAGEKAVVAELQKEFEINKVHLQLLIDAEKNIKANGVAPNTANNGAPKTEEPQTKQKPVIERNTAHWTTTTVWISNYKEGSIFDAIDKLKANYTINEADLDDLVKEAQLLIKGKEAKKGKDIKEPTTEEKAAKMQKRQPEKVTA